MLKPFVDIISQCQVSFALEFISYVASLISAFCIVCMTTYNLGARSGFLATPLLAHLIRGSPPEI